MGGLFQLFGEGGDFQDWVITHFLTITVGLGIVFWCLWVGHLALLMCNTEVQGLVEVGLSPV